MSSPVIYELEALTDLWTGDSGGKAARLVTTGLLGSIRWWFEIVVHGLGGAACDPSDAMSRPDGPGQAKRGLRTLRLYEMVRNYRFYVLDAYRIPGHDQMKMWTDRSRPLYRGDRNAAGQ